MKKNRKKNEKLNINRSTELREISRMNQEKIGELGILGRQLKMQDSIATWKSRLGTSPAEVVIGWWQMRRTA